MTSITGTFYSPSAILIIAAFILLLMTVMLINEAKVTAYRYSVQSKVFLWGTIGLMLMSVVSIIILAIGIL